MRVSVCRPNDLAPEEIDRWRAWQGARPVFANPFLSPDFARAADEVREDTRVAVVTDGHCTVGFMPFTRGAGGMALPVAPGFNDRQAFIHAEGLEWSWSELLRDARLRAWRFDHLVAEQAPSAREHPGRSTLDGSFVIDLDGGWDGYRCWLAEHRGRYLNWLERKARRAGTTLPELTFSFDDGPEALTALMDLKSAQCRRLGWEDVFADGWRRELVRRLAATRTSTCTGVTSVLRSGDRVIAADFSLRQGPLYVGWLIAYDDDVRQLSPGVVRWAHLLREASAVGVRTVDLGRGTDEFKRRFSTRQEDVAVGWLVAGRQLGRAAAVIGAGVERVRPRLEPVARRAIRRVRRAHYRRS